MRECLEVVFAGYSLSVMISFSSWLSPESHPEGCVQNRTTPVPLARPGASSPSGQLKYDPMRRSRDEVGY